MKRIVEFAFPIGVIAAWVFVSVYTTISLHGMDRDWQSRRATVSATPET
jgi:hypothetical protein